PRHRWRPGADTPADCDRGAGGGGDTRRAADHTDHAHRRDDTHRRDDPHLGRDTYGDRAPADQRDRRALHNRLAQPRWAGDLWVAAEWADPALERRGGAVFRARTAGVSPRAGRHGVCGADWATGSGTGLRDASGGSSERGWRSSVVLHRDRPRDRALVPQL